MWRIKLRTNSMGIFQTRLIAHGVGCALELQVRVCASLMNQKGGTPMPTLRRGTTRVVRIEESRSAFFAHDSESKPKVPFK